MSAVDELKKARSKNYPDQMGDPDEPVETSRIIKLSDDEQKTFEGTKPGEELACEVRGNLEEDGHFHVMSVKPLGGASSYTEGNKDENGMAAQVAQRVQPQLMPSVS